MRKGIVMVMSLLFGCLSVAFGLGACTCLSSTEKAPAVAEEAAEVVAVAEDNSHLPKQKKTWKFYSKSFFSKFSRISTAFDAAPFLILSATHQKLIPLSTE